MYCRSKVLWGLGLYCVVREPEGWIDMSYVLCGEVLSTIYVHFVWFMDSAMSQVMGSLSPDGSIEV